MLSSYSTNSVLWAVALGLGPSSKLHERIAGSYFLLHLGTRGWITFPFLLRTGSMRTGRHLKGSTWSIVLTPSSRKSIGT